MTPPAVCVLMSTWERPAHLALALAGYLRQTRRRRLRADRRRRRLGARDRRRRAPLRRAGALPGAARLARARRPPPHGHLEPGGRAHERASRCSTPTATACRRRTCVAVHRRELEPANAADRRLRARAPGDRRRRRRRLGARAASTSACSARASGSPCCAVTPRTSGRSAPGAGAGRTISGST